MSASIPRDVQEFLQDYPGQEDDPQQTDNLLFYRNELRCRPDNLLIEDLHRKWHGDYDKLESKHGFIQWLFPIQEHGMNYESQPLQKHERESMRTDPAVVERVVKSYQLMLDFYGMRLVDVGTGLVERSLPPRNYAARYQNLIRSSHNNLRISRIMKHLHEMGLDQLAAGFLLHVLSEQSEHSELSSRTLLSSMDRWWANCLRNDGERAWIGACIDQVRSGEAKFTRDTYEAALLRRQETGDLAEAAAQVGTGAETGP